MADRDLAAIGKTRFETRTLAPLDDRDLVTRRRQKIGRRYANHAAAEHNDIHRRILKRSPCCRDSTE